MPAPIRFQSHTDVQVYMDTNLTLFVKTLDIQTWYSRARRSRNSSELWADLMSKIDHEAEDSFAFHNMAKLFDAGFMSFVVEGLITFRHSVDGLRNGNSADVERTVRCVWHLFLLLFNSAHATSDCNSSMLCTICLPSSWQSYLRTCLEISQLRGIQPHSAKQPEREKHS